jgi:hypothetical protein
MQQLAGTRPAPVEAATSASARRLHLLSERRGELRDQLVRRFWLRWHMVLMLLATFGAGLLANRLLLAVPVHSMAWRWLLALAVSYLAFFICVRIWLAYVGARAIVNDDWIPDAILNGDPASPGFTLPQVFSGGGGRSGGGGASVAWDSVPDVASPIRNVVGGLTGGLDVDDGGFLLMVIGIVVLALVTAVTGAAVYLFVLAPVLLVDAAFSALLAGGLVKSVRRMDEPDWEGSVLRSTWKPFAVVAMMATVAAVVIHVMVPGARTLGEILMLLR